jgi:hypothetical protein
LLTVCVDRCAVTFTKEQLPAIAELAFYYDHKPLLSKVDRFMSDGKYSTG